MSVKSDKAEAAATAATAKQDAKDLKASAAALKSSIADAAIAHIEAHDLLDQTTKDIQDGRVGAGVLVEVSLAEAATRQVLAGLVADLKGDQDEAGAPEDG